MSGDSAKAESLTSAVAKLSLQSNDNNANEAGLDELLHILTTEGCEGEDSIKALVEGELLPTLHDLLDSPKHANKEKPAHVLAEIAKLECARLPCVEHHLVPPLVHLMSCTDLPTATQACRALGNICFDNDAARTVVDENNGLTKLMGMLHVQLDTTEAGSEKMRMILCGLLLNLTNMHDEVTERYQTYEIKAESIQEKAVSQGALEVMQKYLQQHGDDESVCQMALMSIGSLADSESGREHVVESQVAVTIADMLGTDVGRELQDSIMDLLSTLAESEEIKVQLAKSSLKAHLVSMLKSCHGASGEENEQAQKLASDLVVLLLTGDSSMDILYEDGDGVIFKESLSWLESNNEHLQISGALALGNFARNDNHCKWLVELGITKTLVTILRNPSKKEPSATLQHAIFSALRNLAIPGANKATMVESGIMETVMSYIKTDLAPVQFKLLGMLRMLVDGQESAAKYLGTNDVFLARLVEWCKVEDHAGVKGEANRLLALLVKHSRSADVMRKVVEYGGSTHLVAMTTSEHAVMQNEALVALAMITAVILDEASDSLESAGVVAAVSSQLTEAKCAPEILCNVLTMVTNMAASDKLRAAMQAGDVPSAVQALTKHADDKVQSMAKSTLSSLEKG